MNIYIPRLSNCGIHAISKGTKSLTNNSAKTFRVRTLVDPENFQRDLHARMVNISVCASIIPDGVETTSGVSSSVDPLTAMITNYLAPMLYEGSLTRQTGDGHSSFVGSVDDLPCDRMSYSCLQALHDLSSGSHQWLFSLRFNKLPTHPLWIHPIHLLGIVTSFIPYASL